METLRFIVLTPNKRIVDVSNVSDVYFKTDSGIVGIFPGHASMIASVGVGSVVYNQGETAGYLKVSGGVANIDNDVVTLMVDIAEEASSIDPERAKRALDRAESRLAAKELSDIDVARAQAAKERATARLEAYERYTESKKSPSKSPNKNNVTKS